MSLSQNADELLKYLLIHSASDGWIPSIEVPEHINRQAVTSELLNAKYLSNVSYLGRRNIGCQLTELAFAYPDMQVNEAATAPELPHDSTIGMQTNTKEQNKENHILLDEDANDNEDDSQKTTLNNILKTVAAALGIILTTLGIIAGILTLWDRFNPDTFPTEARLRDIIGTSGIMQSEKMYTFDVPDSCCYIEYLVNYPNDSKMVKAYPGERVTTTFALFYADEYASKWPMSYSGWGEWLIYTYNPENPPKFGLFPTMEVEDLGINTIENGYVYTKGDPITQTKIFEIDSASINGYQGFTYFSDGEIRYAMRDNEQWTPAGQYELTGSATDTIFERWTFIGLAEDYDTSKVTLWNKETRRIGIVDKDTNNIQFDDETISEGKTAEVRLFLTNSYTEIVGYTELKTLQRKDVYQYRYRRRMAAKFDFGSPSSSVINGA